MYHVAAFYRFAKFLDYREFKESWYREAKCRGIKGTILLAEEGINGTMAVPNNQDTLSDFLDNVVGLYPGLEKVERKWSQAQNEPFRKLKVRLKKEIVTLGVPGTSPSLSGGKHVGVSRWNELLSDPNTLVIDTRNDYEVALGTFKGAINPRTASFRDFPEYVKAQLHNQRGRPVAMFCTGGIRCEKASAYMRDQGFNEVYQLDGGILNYLATVDKKHSQWEGDCFVFDDRVAVTHNLEPSGHSMCSACRQPISNEDKSDKRYVAGESCPACFGTKSEEALQSSRERYKQIILAAQRGEQHLRRD